MHVKNLIATQTTALSIDEQLWCKHIRARQKNCRSFNALAACEKREKERQRQHRAAAAKAYKEKIAHSCVSAATTSSHSSRTFC